MGNRDKHGREKKKPKKKDIKPLSRPVRPAPEYKPVAPPQPPATEDKPVAPPQPGRSDELS